MELRNNYWVLRHGRSRANDQHMIVSTVENGVPPHYGLSELGREQASQAGEQLKAELVHRGSTSLNFWVYASPLTRTLETAVIVAEHLGILTTDFTFQVVPELIERNFGVYELQSDENYAKVWEADTRNIRGAPPGGGESVEQVAERVRALFAGLESANESKDIVLVSHGDTLSILWAVVKGLPLQDHRRHGLATGQLKQLHAVS